MDEDKQKRRDVLIPSLGISFICCILVWADAVQIKTLGRWLMTCRMITGHTCTETGKERKPELRTVMLNIVVNCSKAVVDRAIPHILMIRILLQVTEAPFSCGFLRYHLECTTKGWRRWFLNHISWLLTVYDIKLNSDISIFISIDYIRKTRKVIVAWARHGGVHQ